jgi:outer membrane protein
VGGRVVSLNLLQVGTVLVGAKSFLFGAVALAAIASGGTTASATSLMQALAAAYLNNPTLNAARAEQRAIDEGVPQALAGFRPTVGATATTGTTWTRNGGVSGTGSSWSVGIAVEQPLFNGFRTVNALKASESAVLAGRESLRSTEQSVLLDAVTAFMNVVREQAIVGLTAQNVDFLREQTRAAQDRLDVGEGTRTDLAQNQAAEATGVSDYNLAVANLNAAIAFYFQVVGEQPRSLAAAPVAKNVPRSAEEATNLAMNDNPAVIASQYNVDIGAFNVSILEGGLLPTVSVTGSVQRGTGGAAPGITDSASVMGRLSVPIYEGGAISSQVRQAKERLGGLRIQVDITRDAVRAQAVSALGLLNAAQAQIRAAQAGVRAAQLALDGVQEERRVGQSTTLDVLIAQQALLNARVLLVRAQRDAVVASYTLLSAVGRLDATSLALKVTPYQPAEHYEQVRDKWFGLRTPDGR